MAFRLHKHIILQPLGYLFSDDVIVYIMSHLIKVDILPLASDILLPMDVIYRPVVLSRGGDAFCSRVQRSAAGAFTLFPWRKSSEVPQ